MNFNLSLNDRIALTVAERYGFNRRSVTIDERSGLIYAGSEYCGTIDDRRNRIVFDRQGFDAATYFLDGINPVVKRTALRAYPGWTILEYSDGKFVADGSDIALSPGYDTFGEAVGFAKRGGASA
jgi:hypothetical protein